LACMSSEAKTCQNCKNQFVIEPNDLAFYERLEVPIPTYCPRCRAQRRMSWRNERSLYKRRCSAPGHTEDIISMYAPDTPYVVYDAKYWWSDEWDPLAYGRDYDFSKPFFEQFTELLKTAPLLTLANINSVDSDYTNFVEQNRGCYLIFGSGGNEQVRYSNKSMHNRDSQDLFVVEKSELCHECVDCRESYELRYSVNCRNCTDSWFLYECRGCTNCFGCSNLINKSYCIWNKQYPKEEYVEKLKEFNLESRQSIEKLKKKFWEEIYPRAVHRFAYIVGSSRVTGNNIHNSKNCLNCFDIHGEVEDSKNLIHAMQVKDTADAMGPWRVELSYELVDCNEVNRLLGTLTVYNSNDIYYSINCHSCSNLFGCSGLRNKQYCILNKQYSKEDYERHKEQAIEHMKKNGEFGEFFPIRLSPWAYNETIAQEYFPLTKEETLTKGYRWRDPDTRSYSVTMPSNRIPDRIKDISDSITQEVIGCAHEGKCNEQCTTAFKIINQELQFYQRLNLPLPELCPNCRHYQRLRQRIPLQLWHRRCTCAGVRSERSVYTNTATHFHGSNHCPNEFQTSYSPDRPEIVYCEQCYQSEVV